MKKYLIIPILCLITFLSACNQDATLKDWIHADIYRNSDMILQYKDTVDMQPYFEALIASPTTGTVTTTDLSYQLVVKTYDQTLTYQLVFDLTEEKAAALSNAGSYEIPFEWLDAYLVADLPEEQFSYLMPPKMSLSIDDYQIGYGEDIHWSIHPTASSTIPVESTTISHENYKSSDKTLAIAIDFDRMQPDRLSLLIIGIDDVLTYDNITADNIPIPEEDGAYRYELTGHWTSNSDTCGGTVTYSFGLSLSTPASFDLNDQIFEPGDCMAIRIQNPDSLDYRVETYAYNRTIGLFYMEEDLVGLIPLDSKTAPGNYSLYIYKDSTDQLLKTLTYEVTTKEFNTQQLSVTSSTASLKSDDNYAKDAEKFGDAKDYSVGEQLWEGTFIEPVSGRVSTEYGTIRYVNGNTESSRHNAIDVAAATGTPVMAANNGIVTFASDLIISGNVVVLDHGYGLFSSYVHLDEIFVQDGDEVKKGQIVGSVGATGYATGPHLHWSIWKNGVYLNPWKFIEEDLFTNFQE